MRLAAYLGDWLASGQAVAGSRLPAIRTVAAAYGLDKATVTKAYQALIGRGLLVRRGRGTHATLIVPDHRGPPQLPQTVLVIDDWMRHLRIDPAAPQGSPHRILHSFAAGCQARGWSVLLSSTPQALQQLSMFSPSVIVTIQVGTRAQEVVDLANQRSIPVVVYGDLLDAPNCDRVCADHAAGVQQLVQELQRRGRRRIAQVLLPVNEPWAMERQRGYREAMAACRLRPLPLISLGEDGQWRDPALPLLLRSQIVAGQLARIVTSRTPPDAILAPSDGEAMVLGAAIRLFNLRVHADIAVVGYDDYWEQGLELGQGAPAPLLTIDKDNAGIGSALAERAIARGEGSATDVPQCIRITPRLRTNREAPSPPHVRTRR
jgi:DNA-binding LacI/PurR family transcriptional regulator